MKVVRIVPGFALFVFLVGCTSFWPPAVSESKIKADLAGQRLEYAHSLFSPGVWTIHKDEIKGWRVLQRSTDRKAGTDVVRAAVHLEDGAQSISGNLKITYRLYDQGWQLEKVVPDSEFTTAARSQGE